MEKNFFKKFLELNTSLNNTNTFLLDISLPIINYLINKNDDFQELFEQACYNNRRFACESLEHDLFEKSFEFLHSMGCGGCEHCNIEFQHQIAGALHEYCLFLLQFVNKDDFHTTLITLSPAFADDYAAIKSSLLNNTITREQAEQAVVYWQGAVSDVVLQEAMVQLRYEYIKKLVI